MILNLDESYKGKYKPVDYLQNTPRKSEFPKITVIVPVYKVDRFLTPCLDSIVNQTLQEIEIIIVDEGEHDRCREIIDYYESHDPRVIAPHKHNGGYGASCNLGIDMARGEYIAIIESDDIILPNMFEDMYSYAKKLDADVVKTPFCFWDGNDNYKDCEYRIMAAQQSPKGKLFSMKDYNYLLSVHASLWSGIYKTKYMKEKSIRFIEAKGGAYVDVGFRIDTLINTDRIAWLDMPYYMYRTNNDESTTNNFDIKIMLKRWNEAHKKFIPLQEDYNQYYASALILDEYLNTLSMANALMSSEQKDMLRENFSYISNEAVISSRVLNKFQKVEIISYKKHPNVFLLEKTILCAVNSIYKYLISINEAFNFNNYIINFGIVSLLLTVWSIIMMQSGDEFTYTKFFAISMTGVTLILMVVKYATGILRRSIGFWKRCIRKSVNS